MRKSKEGRLNSVIVLIALVFAVSFALSYPYWTPGAPQSITYWNEGSLSYDFSFNVSNQSDSSSDLNYVFGEEPSISSSLYGYQSSSFFDWISLNSSSGILSFDSDSDNQTGRYNVTVDVYYDSGTESVGAKSFYFIINATNDYPNFTLESNYSESVSIGQNKSYNITLVGSDEEEQYPLVYNVSFTDCNFAAWSSRTDGVDCDLTNNISLQSNTTSILELKNMTYDDVGVYNLTICATDNVNATEPPEYRDGDYDFNKTTCYNTTFSLQSSLSVNVSNCSGTSWLENDTLECYIEITTVGATDSVDISSAGTFPNDASPTNVHDSDWFYSATTNTSVGNSIVLNISIPLSKSEVGNWSINFTADDGSVNPYSTNFPIFVNYTEDAVDLRPISDTGALYTNYSFQVNVSDEDLLVWDNSVKKENFTIQSNTSWVSVSVPYQTQDWTTPYRMANVLVDHSLALSLVPVGTYLVNISVTDSAGNFDWETFSVEVANTSAPEWTISEPFNFTLTEDELFSWNLTMNVTDADNDPISFYYQDNDGLFESINSTNFNSNGYINFSPVDYDVGYHNVTIYASDGNLNTSHQFNFTVLNVVDAPSFSSTVSDTEAAEDNETTIYFQVIDDDYYVPDEQALYVDSLENLTVILTFENLTEVVSPISFNFTHYQFLLENEEQFVANFTPDGDNVGDYNVTINVTDVFGNWTVDYFILNITSVNDMPNLTNVVNLRNTTVIDFLYYDFNATDQEDGNDTDGNLIFALYNITGDDILTINSTTGEINLTMSESLAGFYQYNITVNDSSDSVDWQVFNLTIYGIPNLTTPSESSIFRFVEGELNSTNLTIDYAINSTNLTFEFYMDKIVYNDSENYSYTNLTESLRSTENFTWTNESNYTWNFTPDYSDETYGMFKNLSILVYNTEFPELNSTYNFDVNISHTNENISFDGYIPDKGPATYGNTISIDLTDYFSDADYSDEAIRQNVSFTLETVNGSGYVAIASSFDGWTLNLQSNVATTEVLRIIAYEYEIGGNATIGNATSNSFEVEFTEPTVQTRTSPTKTTIVKLQHFSLKLIVPQDIILSDQDYIEVPFSLQNTGTVDLYGISLDSSVLFNNQYSDDISIELEDTYVDSLLIGETKNYTLKVNAETDRAGKYKVTIYGNVTSPKFSDWGDFFIELQKTNESEAEQILIFTEQLIIENPECLELTEVFNRAKEAYESGDSAQAVEIANEVTTACEDAITASDQIQYNVEGFVQRNFYYILFATLTVFLVGFIFYVYKRVRFNKYEGDYTLR